MEPIRILLSRCSALFRRRNLDEDLDAELSSHIEFAVEENMKRGMSAQQARTSMESNRWTARRLQARYSFYCAVPHWRP
jgi:hypothetical protein